MLKIERMRYFDLTKPLNWIWETINYITGNIPPGCSEYELLSYCWAEATAAGIVTGNNEQRGYSNLNKPQFDVVQALTWEMLNGDIIAKYTGYYTMVLSTIINEGGGLYPWIDENAYEWLYNMYEYTSIIVIYVLQWLFFQIKKF